jgi:hypothetical protein
MLLGRFVKHGGSLDLPAHYFPHSRAKWILAPGISRFSVGHLEMKCFSRLRTALGSYFRTDVNRAHFSVLRIIKHGPHSYQTQWPRHRDNAWPLRGLSQLQANVLWWMSGLAHSSEVWRWEIGSVWTLIKDGSWHSRSGGSVFHSCHKLPAAFCFSPETTVALLTPRHCEQIVLCAVKVAWPYSYV